MRGRETNTCFIPFYGKNSDVIPVETKMTRGYWSGRPVVLGIARDVRERQQFESALSIQRDLAISISSIDDLVEAFQSCIDAVLRIDGVDGGGIYLVDPETTGRWICSRPPGCPSTSPIGCATSRRAIFARDWSRRNAPCTQTTRAAIPASPTRADSPV